MDKYYCMPKMCIVITSLHAKMIAIISIAKMSIIAPF